MLLSLLLACPGPTDSGDPIVDTADTTDTADADTDTDSDTATDTDSDTDTDTDTDTAIERSCVEIEAEFVAETERIRQCSDAEDCGQVLTGTSCGCTQDWVARNDADTTDFYALLAEGSAESCGLGTDSDCSCPETDGYACVDEVCTWNYVSEGEAYPACEAADGFATSIDSVTLSGDSLDVLVSYSGGCATHWFTTCWPDQSFMESFPVQAALELLHEGDAPDPCEAWISEEVTVDLMPLRRAYEASYGSSGTIIVGLGGYSVEYSF